MNNTATSNKAVASILASIYIALSLGACGGTPPEEFMQEQKAAGSALPPASSGKFHATSSDFNSSIWDHQSWEECDCGRNASPTQVPWSTSR